MSDIRTTELCKLLDERGAIWRAESYPSTLLSSDQLTDTYWQAGNAEWRFTERPDGRTYLSLIGIWLDCTPEQAVAATLGSGTCKITATSTNNLMYPDYMVEWYELSCGHSLTLKGEEEPRWCAVCGKAVKR